MNVLSLDLVAVGTSSYLGGRGRVVVLQSSGNSFERAGELVGQALEEFGASGNLAGSGGSILVGTYDGRVKRFDLGGASGDWIQLAEDVETGHNGNLKALPTSSTSGTSAVGGNAEAVIYSLALLKKLE